MSDDTKTSQNGSGFISVISVSSLFGRYDYRIQIPGNIQQESSRVCMLYGDNGTGKTTILKLVFHLLSTSRREGHRTFIGSVPFKSFSVEFLDKSKINAFRDEGNLVGTYKLQLLKRDKVETEVLIPLQEGKVKSEVPELEPILNQIATRSLSIYFLGDDRKLVSDELPSSDGAIDRLLSRRLLEEQTSLPIDPRDSALMNSLKQTETWLGQRLISASSKGEVDSQQIYSSVVGEIIKHGIPKISNYEAERKKLIKSLKDIDTRSIPFANFGLVSRLDSKRFITSLAKTDNEGLRSVTQIVLSFIDSQTARLNALEGIKIALDRFVSWINEFLLHKKIHLIAGEGVSIVTDSGELLRPTDLSSGEKQLLLLFCNVITSTSKPASLFIIDEPELSLNVKWQRRLIDSLIDLTSESHCQFLLATHSLELLSKHRSQTVKLNP